MVFFGANHTAERFVDCDRLTKHFPGPGAYDYASRSSAVDVAPGPRWYGDKILEDGCVRPDRSTLLFRDRGSWVTGIDGPKGLACLSVDNPFISPAAYDTEPGERATRRAVPTAFINTREARYLSPSKRCLTPAHERAAKGVESPGPGKYYPNKEAWNNFPPPEKWDDVNKGYWTPRRGFNTKAAWGKASTPRPPTPARAAEVPSNEERMWLTKRRGSMRPNTSPRCMWVNGVNTKGGLQAWGDVATKIGPTHVGHTLNCAFRGESTPRRGPSAKRRGPVHSGGTRATSPDFREVRYLDRDLTRQTLGTAENTPGPGEYNVRLSMTCGTTFAGPKASHSRAKRAAAAIACANRRTTHNEVGRGRDDIRETSGIGYARGFGGRVWPSPPPAKSQRLSAAPMGAESPGPSAYHLPSGFDRKRCNRKVFSPPPCSTKASEKGKTTKQRGATGLVAADYKHCCSRGGTAGLSRARQTLHQLAA